MIRWEHALISKILDINGFREARDLGVTADHFYLPDTRFAWNWIATYHAKHGVTPSRDAFSDALKGFSFANVNDPLAAVVERIHNHLVYTKTQNFVADLHVLAKAEPLDAANFIVSEGHKFRALLAGTNDKTLINITDRTEAERAAYSQRVECKGILGLEWPWEHMNKMTHGILDGSLNIFYARPGNMKTWLLLYCAMWAHYYKGRHPLVLTREMTPEDLQRRIIAMFCGLDYTRYMEGRLNSDETRKWEEGLEAFAESPSPFNIVTVPGVGAEAAEAILEKIDESGADLLVCDSIYLFGSREHDLIAQFTSTLKRGILERRIPCLGATQRNNPKSGGAAKEASGDDVGYSDSLYQDADVLIHVKLIKEDKRLYLTLPKVREGVISSTMSVWAKPAYDFGQAFVEDNGDGYGEEGDVEPKEAPISE